VVIGLLLTLVALAATLAGAAARPFWIADLTVHFRLQWAAFAIAGCLILAAAGHARWAALAFLIAAVQALTCARLLDSRAPVQASTEPAPSAPLRLAHA